MIVLLKDAFTCATALPTFLRSLAFFFSPPEAAWF